MTFLFSNGRSELLGLLVLDEAVQYLNAVQNEGCSSGDEERSITQEGHIF